MFVGPYDLGNNLLHPMGPSGPDEELQAAIEAIRKAASAAGKKTGIYTSSGDQARKYADQGFNMVTKLRSLSRLFSLSNTGVDRSRGGRWLDHNCCGGRPEQGQGNICTCCVEHC